MSDLSYDWDTIITGIGNFLLKFVTVIQHYEEWYQKNANNIADYLLAFADFNICCSAITKMEDIQIVFTNDLHNDFAKKIYYSENVQDDVQNYFFENNDQRLKKIISRCEKNCLMRGCSEYYTEILSAFQMGHYQLACAGLFSIVDGLLSSITQNPTPKFYKRFEKIAQDIEAKESLSQIDRKLFFIFSSFDVVQNSMFKRVDFAAAEEISINRHRVLHGRTYRQYTKFDFLKVLLFLDALLIVAEANIDTTVDESEATLNA